ncbi:Rrp15p-domain-containing protein [Canariomyces notabilis]|uniref:Rrp15p-domain-containing protein n=1 Tax=Canariomyces notabilis TaxID=2074819 RepID=A0AAN6THN6_9PEZI|nr:Rrp15p-domain-containing protein [Canariomyces arenarius]
MSNQSVKKRSFNEGPKGRAGRPTKKQRKIAAYHSSSDDTDGDDEGGPIPANLLDSDDEDLDDIQVDDGASTEGSSSGSDSDSQSDGARPSKEKSQPPIKQSKKQEFIAKDAPDSDGTSSSEDGNGGESDDDDDDADSAGADDSDGPRAGAGTSTRAAAAHTGTKSKRNDPDAFATSISKMLSSKLPVSRRADPIVARSGAAAEQARQAVDAALEAKARKRLREQKRLAMEKGRVRDVLVASTTRTLNVATGEIEEVPEEGAQTTAQILEMEKRLRKVAQRGVVKLFNAVRAAQVKAAEAEREARKEGIVGVKRREEKVTEMSRKGFLDLIASGGGGLKKGGLEEA